MNDTLPLKDHFVMKGYTVLGVIIYVHYVFHADRDVWLLGWTWSRSAWQWFRTFTSLMLLKMVISSIKKYESTNISEAIQRYSF